MNKVYYCFPGGKHKALTLSYDDGKLQDRRLVDMFNRYGLKATFNINSGLFNDEKRIKPEEIRTLYQGHEIACHTLTHPTIARCPLAEVAEEVLADRVALERLTGYPVRGLAYPNGSLSEEIVKLLPGLGIEYGRVVGSSDSFALPENLLRWQATCHHNHNLLSLGEQFNALFKKQYLYLMYVWGHSYEFDDRGNWDMMEDFCRLVGGKDDVWYCTNIGYVDWKNAVERLKFAADNSFVYNPNAVSCWIRINDGEPVELPAGAVTKLSD